MLIKWAVALALVVASGGAGVAQQMCGDPPIAPLVPSPTEMRQKSPVDAAATRHSSFLDVTSWQGQLKSYRDCLNATTDTDRRKLGEMQRSDKPDKDKMAKLTEEMKNTSHAFDSSVDQEERVVNEFHAAQVAYCTRSDVNRATCPKS